MTIIVKFTLKKMSDEFTEQILKICIAKAAQQYGFTTISETALDILAEAVIGHMKEICTNATRITIHCGRIDTNGYDLFYALNNCYNRESVFTLSQFLAQPEKQIPQFEFFVDNYPAFEKNVNPFYEQQLEKNTQTTTPGMKSMPFRAYNPPETKESNGRSSHIPAFYPNFPDTYTYNTPTPLQEPATDENIEKHRANDQNALQKEIEEMSKSQDNKSQQVVQFDSELTKLLSREMVRRPTALLESPIYELTGIRPEIDPEFLPVENVKLDSSKGRDENASLRILNIHHKNNFPGKNADDKSEKNDKNENADN